MMTYFTSYIVPIPEKQHPWDAAHFVDQKGQLRSLVLLSCYKCMDQFLFISVFFVELFDSGNYFNADRSWLNLKPQVNMQSLNDSLLQISCLKWCDVPNLLSKGVGGSSDDLFRLIFRSNS